MENNEVVKTVTGIGKGVQCSTGDSEVIKAVRNSIVNQIRLVKNI